ncbi:Hpt domain-containing protein [Paenibacillus sp. OV219]|uniref:Hpt domain-containing protein n=1 Tax=Paenibacillus sp. OV219 TaxID=1884377 RepID=UPI0008CFFED1|nr:Hpt domain-containing protein [Paenibacillus sp. OV219]SEM58998.1 HPt (histidine-containing phosphotransfer) domain-containing protein [Paenibacillus sp. OV219]
MAPLKKNKYKRLDMQAAIRRLGNNEELYGTILELFVNNHRNVSEEIRKEFAAGNRESAIMVAHSFKGAALNVGVSELAEQAELIIRHIPAAQLDTIQQLLNELDRQMKELMELIGESHRK